MLRVGAPETTDSVGAPEREGAREGFPPPVVDSFRDLARVREAGGAADETADGAAGTGGGGNMASWC